MRRESAEEVLRRIIASPHEDETVEFKDRKTLDKDEMGCYFSALSNEAELRDVHSAWVVFGIRDDGQVTGTNYLDTKESRNWLKHYISEHTTGAMSFRDVHEMSVEGRRVLMFEIPSAQHGMPTSFKGFAYERQGESLVPLSEEKRRRIMSKTIPDWSAQTVPGVGIEVLDPVAVAAARKLYRMRSPDSAEESEGWSDLEFLSRMRLVVNGSVTHSAIVLLGADGASDLIPGSSLYLKWVLKDADDMTLTGETFGTPFILGIERLYSRIRNLEYSDFRSKTLGKSSTDTYDPSAVRELLYNAIAHQDYLMRETVTVYEFDRDRLVFVNAGDFIPGSVDRVIGDEAPSFRYRNEHLARAMSRLGMVETIGTGIQRVFQSQIDRMFPLPEYRLDDEHVRVTLYGRSKDARYREILMRNPDLRFREIVCLDRISKGKAADGAVAEGLADRGLVHRTPEGYALAGSAAARGEGAGPITMSGCRELILSYLREHGTATRGELDGMLFVRMPDTMADETKRVRVSNALQALRRSGEIVMGGTTRKPVYSLPGE